MSYTALYRKFRPNDLSDVKGQDAIVKTLSNQIMTGRIGHAYLFCGTRGTGKTTVAKILAKAVNCEAPTPNGPCGECASCRAISEGSTMNVIEIDAASNNGVDNVREIRDEVAYAPTDGKYKVYIIDEVHMLSGSAFNALLKTLEEPPAYVIFILATTEPHKLPATILSRCQRYDFKRIPTGTIVERMKELLQIESIEAEEEALEFIARTADGGMRDALSILDQCISFYPDRKISYSDVLEILGAVDSSVFGKLFEALVSKNVLETLRILDDSISNGREISQFITDFVWHLRNLLLVSSTGEGQEIPGISKESVSRYREQAKISDTESISEYIRILSELINEIKFSTQKRVLTEIALIKLCKEGTTGKKASEEIVKTSNSNGNDCSISNENGNAGSAENSDANEEIKELYRRIEYLENKLEKEIAFVKAHPVSGEKQPPLKKPELPASIPEDVEKVVKNFRTIVKDMDPVLKVSLEKANLSLSKNGNLMMVFPNGDNGFELCKRRKDVLEDYISEKSGVKIHIEYEELPPGRACSDMYADLEKVIKMPIENEDF